MFKESRNDLIFRGVITVILCIVGIIALIPMITVLAMSFSSKSASDMNIVNLWPVDFTLASWKYILSNNQIWKSFGITLVSTIIGTVLSLLVNALMAYPLSKKEFRLSRFLMICIVITMIFKAPTVPYFLTVRSIGLFNNPLVLVLPHIVSAYNLSIMRTFFQQFPSEIEEAAKIDGCGLFKLLFQIVLPSSKAVMATVGLFYAVTYWNQFQTPLLFIQDTSWFPLQLKIQQLINGTSELQTIASSAGINYNERTLRSAVIIYAIIPIIAIYPYLQKHFAKGAMLGSVKG